MCNTDAGNLSATCTRDICPTMEVCKDGWRIPGTLRPMTYPPFCLSLQSLTCFHNGMKSSITTTTTTGNKHEPTHTQGTSPQAQVRTFDAHQPPPPSLPASSSPPSQRQAKAHWIILSSSPAPPQDPLSPCDVTSHTTMTKSIQLSLCSS